MRAETSLLITISSNAAPGFYEVRVVGRFGISNPRIFAVDIMPEIAVANTNTSASAAAEVPQGAWLNGRVDAGTYAFFRFKAEKGQRLLVECLENQIDSRLDATLILYDARQHEVARNRRGGLLDYAVPADGTFVLRLNDFLFRGGSEYFYRLLISHGPHIDFVLPPAGLPGTTNKHLLYGRNLPGGKPSAFATVDGKKLEELPVEIPLPSDLAAAGNSGRQSTLHIADAVVDSIEYRLSASNGLSDPC